MPSQLPSRPVGVTSTVPLNDIAAVFVQAMSEEPLPSTTIVPPPAKLDPICVGAPMVALLVAFRVSVAPLAMVMALLVAMALLTSSSVPELMFVAPE